ncbi:MAG: NADH-quinone oxidoreductase subunit C, partial [Endomicrobiia bacterium]|nr:NADH-quinone oxidoreductase subunit C [Endomicrobiia bacterium]
GQTYSRFGRKKMSERAIDNILAEKAGVIKKSFEKNPRRWYLDIEKSALEDMARYIFKTLGLRFSITTAIDTREDIELLYHFSDDASGDVITLRVFAGSREKPEMPSLAPLAKAFEWIEREINEMFGVDFNGHPDMKRLLLSDDWPSGKYPLRQNQNDPK